MSLGTARQPYAWLFGGLSWLLGGVLYPVMVLPEWLRQLSVLLPITYAIEGCAPSCSGQHHGLSYGTVLARSCFLFPLSFPSASRVSGMRPDMRASPVPWHSIENEVRLQLDLM